MPKTVKPLTLAALAAIVAPFPALLFVGVVGLPFGHHPVGETLVSVVKGAALMTLLGMVYSVPAALLYGVPLFLVLRKFDRANLFTCMAAALLPLGAAALYEPMRGTLEHFLIFAYLFLSSALAFWYFARHAVGHAHPHVSAGVVS